MKPVNDEIPEPKSPCPFCKELVADYNDDCPKCLNYIPFCIASGKYLFIDVDTSLPKIWLNANIANFIAITQQLRECWIAQKLRKHVRCVELILRLMI